MRPFFVGNEASQAPEVVELVALARRIAERTTPATAGAVSLRNGPRCIVNVADVPFAQLGLGDFVEVADFDPTTGKLMCLGTRGPAREAPLLAMLYRAKAEVGAAAVVRLGAGHAALAGTPEVRKDPRPIVAATETLSALREASEVSLGGEDLLAAGRSLPELGRRLEARLVKPA